MSGQHFTYLAIGCGIAAVISSHFHVDARFMSLTWALLAIAAAILAIGGAS